MVVADIFNWSPEACRCIREWHQIVMRGDSPLSVAERELVGAYTSGVNSCDLCYGAHKLVAEELLPGVVGQAGRLDACYRDRFIVVWQIAGDAYCAQHLIIGVQNDDAASPWYELAFGNADQALDEVRTLLRRLLPNSAADRAHTDSGICLADGDSGSQCRARPILAAECLQMRAIVEYSDRHRIEIEFPGFLQRAIQNFFGVFECQSSHAYLHFSFRSAT